VSFAIYDGSPGPGFWERDNSHFPLPMSRHLWELFLPAYDTGTRRGLARYGSLIGHFDFARVKGRLYLKTCFIQDAGERENRARAAEEALERKLWRQDCIDWQEVREQLRDRLLRFSAADPAAMDVPALQAHIHALRRIFVEGTLRHFFQQPSSMFPVGDWVRNACQWTGCAPAEALSLLIGSHAGSADFFGAPDRLDEYADRIITGFDLVDLTLRELPQLRSGTLASLKGVQSRPQPTAETAEREAQLRERLPAEHRAEFDRGLLEARAAYGLHDEDVRITYLWPLGLMRRAIQRAAGYLIDKGRLAQSDHIFQTTPVELDAMLRGIPSPDSVEMADRAREFAAWKDEKLPPSFGVKEAAHFNGLSAACGRVNDAIMFYLGQMEDQLSQNGAPSWSLMVAGLAASPGRYEGWARVVRQPADFKKLLKGDVLVAPTTSPAYNVILPMIGAVVTDRGGALSHCAIVAREFGIPAVVGTDQATSRIPDGARILVDGDRGFVAVRA
jgi:pyruvate,water dikinase